MRSKTARQLFRKMGDRLIAGAHMDDLLGAGDEGKLKLLVATLRVDLEEAADIDHGRVLCEGEPRVRRAVPEGVGGYGVE